MSQPIPTLEELQSRQPLQQPTYADQARLERVIAELRKRPPLVFAGECDELREKIADAAAGSAEVSEVVSLVASMSFLSACGGGNAKPSGNTPDAAAPTPPPETPSETGCGRHGNCSTCMGERGCGWCHNLNRCVAGHWANGASHGACGGDNWVTGADRCDDRCARIRDCGASSWSRQVLGSPIGSISSSDTCPRLKNASLARACDGSPLYSVRARS